MEFTVTDDYEEDDDEPWYKIEYGADDEEDLCTITPGNPGCDQQWWWAKFRIQDEDSGLKSVKVEPTGKQTYAEAVYYRYFFLSKSKSAEILLQVSKIESGKCVAKRLFASRGTHCCCVEYFIKKF